MNLNLAMNKIIGKSTPFQGKEIRVKFVNQEVLKTARMILKEYAADFNNLARR